MIPPALPRWGAHVFLWARDATTASFSDAIDRAASLGLGWIQLSLTQPDGLDLAQLRNRAREREIGIVSGLVLPPGLDPVQRPIEALDVIKAAIDSTVVLGARLLAGAIYTPLGYRGKVDPSRTRASLQQILSGAAQLAADAGIVIAVEPLNRYESSLINTAADALALIDEVGASSLRLQLDTFHMNIEEADFARPIELAGPRLGFVQAAESHRGLLGTGHVDWGALGGALRRIDYEGPIVLETFGVGNPVLASATATWVDRIGDPDAFVRQSIAFLSETLDS